MEDLLKRVSDLFYSEREIGNSITLAANDDKRVKPPMTFPGINVYSFAVIMSEIDEDPNNIPIMISFHKIKAIFKEFRDIN